jgi:hypothetical protein
MLHGYGRGRGTSRFKIFIKDESIEIHVQFCWLLSNKMIIKIVNILNI